jgi:hypothetical protein
MTETQIARFSKSMEAQGVGLTRTKKGLLLRLPDETTTMIHFTNSDVRAEANVKARLRRAGVTHPDDNKVADLPAYITQGRIREDAKVRLFAWVREKGYPENVYSKQLVADLGWDPGQANRNLFHCGFVAQNAIDKKGRPWATPEWLLEEGIQAEQDAEAESPTIEEPLMEFVHRAQAAQQAVNELGAGVPEVKVQGREFIDTYDSWIVDLSALPQHLTIGDYFGALAASGVTGEVRLWRA